MREKQKGPFVPPDEQLSVRERIKAALRLGPMTLRDLSQAVGISEKAVPEHLEHVARSLHATGGRIDVLPAVCEGCGFSFKKRERFTKPGRCPVCGGNRITPPAYRIREEG